VKRLLPLILIALFVVSVSIAQSEFDDELNEILAEYVAEDDLAVVVLVSSDGGQRWVGAAGLADLENGVAAQPTDRFRIGSITKTYVATAIMMLVEEGEFSLDDCICILLPENIVNNVENANEVTVLQLLNMTGGIADYTEDDDFWEAVESNPDQQWTAEDTISYIFDDDAYFEPGEDFYYSNSHYNLLQIIIEDVTGQSLADALDEYIFTPLNLEDTYLENPANIAEGIVQGYSTADSGTPQNITTINEGVGLGDGGIISTVGDMETFARALFEDKLIEDDSLSIMMDYVNDNDGGLYGLGISASESDYGMLVGHDGATAGFQSTMTYVEEEGIVIIGLTNDFDSEILTDLMDEILDIVVGD